MIKKEKVTPIKMGYKLKPIGHYKSSDIGYGFGLFWIEKWSFKGGSYFYTLSSFPENKTIGMSGYSERNYYFLEGIYNNCTCKNLKLML